MEPKISYEVDPHNRIISKRTDAASGVKKFRQVILGRFGTDGSNNLYYEINKSQGIDIPQKIRFSGKYSLDKKHSLIFTLDKWNNQCEGNRLALKTRIIDVNSNEIAFLMNSKIGEGKETVYLMKLYGTWQADKHNRLTFGIEKDGERCDVLTLYGLWEVNKNNEIIYRYGSASRELIFRGRWDIGKRYRLSYILNKKINSGFNFKTSLGRLVSRGMEKYLAFDIGIGIAGTKKIRKKIFFSGTWRLDKNNEFLLETQGPDHAGVTLRFSKQIFSRCGIAYIESLLRGKEQFIGGGIVFRW